MAGRGGARGERDYWEKARTEKARQRRTGKKPGRRPDGKRARPALRGSAKPRTAAPSPRVVAQSVWLFPLWRVPPRHTTRAAATGRSVTGYTPDDAAFTLHRYRVNSPVLSDA